MQVTQLAEGVYLAPQPVATIGREELDFVRAAALAAPRGRARINLHATDQAAVHEMFIAISAASYIRPHRHLHKSEAFHIVEGALTVVLFDDAGQATRYIRLDAEAAAGTRYYRLSSAQYHTVLVHTPVVVMHEITSGPFDPAGTEYATFSPAENDVAAAAAYREALCASARECAAAL